MKTILAAVDFSSASDAVMTESIALARATKGRIVLVTVVQPPVITSEFALNVADIAAITADAERAATNHLSRLKDRLRTLRIPARSVQATGAAVTHLLDQADTVSANYIVMGSHGHTAFYDLLV